jgi:hypothetical protein
MWKSEALKIVFGQFKKCGSNKGIFVFQLSIVDKFQATNYYQQQMYNSLISNN